jgi:hypothetical protein
MIVRVAASESALLAVARALVGEVSADGVARVLRQELPVDQLRRTSMRLLKATLARGVVLELARRGGWRARRYLKGGVPVTGRIWEVRDPPELRFTCVSFEVCRWLASAPLVNSHVRALHVEGSPSLADEVVLYLAADLLERTGLSRAMLCAPVFAQSPLVWLGFADVLHLRHAAAPSTTALATGDGAIVVEALADHLARRWAHIESGRRSLAECESIQRLCSAEEAVLSDFLIRCSAADRRDLTGFLMEAGRQVLHEAPQARLWCPSLDLSASLRDRAAARRATGVFLRQLTTLRRWVEEARNTAFFEDDYQAAQAFAGQWEQLGDNTFAKGEGILRELESMDFDAPPAGSPSEQGT